MRAALAIAAVLAGCAGSRFDDLREQAWADATDVPDGVGGEEYPIALAPLATERTGTHLVAIAADPPGLATISYDISGTYEATGVDLPEIDLAAVATTRASVAAATAPVRGADAAVAVGGLGARGALLVYDARTGALGPELRRVVESTVCGSAISDLGRHMVWTRTNLGDPDAPDLIASGDGELIALIDLAADGTAVSCLRCAIDPIQSMVAADFDPSSPGDELAIGVSSSVQLFRASLILQHDTAGARCFTAASPLATIPSEGGDFGAVLAVGSSNALVTPELAIAAPSIGKVFMFSDFGTSGPSGPAQALTAEGSSTSFATTLAFADLDRDGFDELIVGDAGADIAGKVRAGRATLYAATSSPGPVTFTQIGALHDRQPVRDQRFGQAFAVAQHTGTLGTTAVVAVGAATELFLYFRTLTTSTDPRE